jgi:glycerophosphoryl diester phosphodiesterase
MPSCAPNTREAFAAAFEAGADVIAVPARLTADGVLVLMRHDAVALPSGVEKKVGELTLDALSECAMAGRDGTRPGDAVASRRGLPLTLDQALECFPEGRFNIELLSRGRKAAVALASVLDSRAARDRVLVYCPHGGTLRMVRKALPDVATSLSLTGVLGLYALFRTGFLFLKQGFRADALQIPEMIGPSYIGNQGMVRECSQRGLKIYISVDNTPAQIARLRESGVDGYITDDVPTLKSLLD